MNPVQRLEEWAARLSHSNAKEVERALESLGAALDDEDAALRERAARLLLEEVARPASQVRAALFTLLQSSWWPPPEHLAPTAMQAVIAGLQHVREDAPEVNEAAFVLANVCRVASAELSTLEAALAHPHPAVRRAAAGAVGRIGDAALPLLPKLLPCLAEEGPVGDAALESFGSLAPKAPASTAPVLLDQVRRSEGARRYLALISLRSLLEEPRRQGRALPALPSLEDVLLPTLEETEPTARLEVVALLGLTGAVSPAAVTALLEHLRDASADVAARAAVSLLRLGAHVPEALTTLAGQLAKADPEQHGAALSALEGLEAATLKRAKPVLEEAARTGPEPVRETMRELLAPLRD